MNPSCAEMHYILAILQSSMSIEVLFFYCGSTTKSDVKPAISVPVVNAVGSVVPFVTTK